MTDFVSFGPFYQGDDLLLMMEKRSHPALRQRSKFSHSIIFEEMEAAALWGIEPDQYWSLSRESRKMMTATLRFRRVIDAIDAWDRKPKK